MLLIASFLCKPPFYCSERDLVVGCTRIHRGHEILPTFPPREYCLRHNAHGPTPPLGTWLTSDRKHQPSSTKYSVSQNRILWDTNCLRPTWWLRPLGNDSSPVFWRALSKVWLLVFLNMAAASYYEDLPYPYPSPVQERLVRIHLRVPLILILHI